MQKRGVGDAVVEIIEIHPPWSRFTADDGRREPGTGLYRRLPRPRFKSSVPADGKRSELLFSAVKWEGNVRVHGGKAFKRVAVEEAVKMGVHILNPEMQAYQQ